MKFYTQYQNQRTPTPAGQEETTEYQRIQNEQTKEWKLKKIGKRNIYNEIQEAGIGTSLKEIITKYQNNEINEIKTNETTYIDTTMLPENKIEFEEHIKYLEQQITETKNKLNQQKLTTNTIYDKIKKETETNEQK